MVIVEGKIKGKARVRFNTKTGRTYSTSNMITYENWIKLCYQQQDGKFLNGEIKAKIFIYYEIPKSYTKKRILAIKEFKELPQKKPDIDNIVKIIFDSLNGIAYKDDCQVVELIAVKRYTEGIERIEFDLQEI